MAKLGWRWLRLRLRRAAALADRGFPLLSKMIVSGRSVTVGRKSWKGVGRDGQFSLSKMTLVGRPVRAGVEELEMCRP